MICQPGELGHLETNPTNAEILGESLTRENRLTRRIKHECWICGVAIAEQFMVRVDELWECRGQVACALRVLGRKHAHPDSWKQREVKRRETIQALDAKLRDPRHLRKREEQRRAAYNPRPRLSKLCVD